MRNSGFLKDEQGQGLILFAVGLIFFLGFVGLSIDVGRYMWSKAEMQASVDSAALAGAQSMQFGTSMASADATEYWNNNRDFIDEHGESGSVLISFPSGNRAIEVEGQAEFSTWFVKFFGVDTWHVSAVGRAEAQVLDIALVLDVSGSMCFTSYPPVEGDGSAFTGVIMSPGRASPAGGFQFPQLATAIPAGGPASITIQLNDVGIFTSTNSGTNRSNFGSSWGSATPYWQRDPDGGGQARAGTIMIDGELFRITSVNAAANELTVSRGQRNFRNGAFTPQQAHNAGAEVWANRGSDGSQGYCDKASKVAATTSVNGPHQPFDDMFVNARYFAGLFDTNYDKIGLATYSTDATLLENLTGSVATLQSAMDGVVYPDGSTNIAHGIGIGRQIVAGSGSRAAATKIVVLLTDGVPNQWCSNGYNSGSCTNQSTGSPSTCPAGSTRAITDSVSQAATAFGEGTIVFTIGLGDGVLDCILEQVAAAGGGAYYKAPTTAQLDDAFRAIAEQTRIRLSQ